MRAQIPLQSIHKRDLLALYPVIDVTSPPKERFRCFIKTLKTPKKYPSDPCFWLKTPQRRLFLGFSCIFLITFFGENEIMCTFAPK